MNLITIHCVWILILFSLQTLSSSESFFNSDNETVDFEANVNDEDVFDLVQQAQGAVPACEKDEFQCTKSLECIEKYKFCDRVVDCRDSSDEITCGVLDFSSRKHASS